VRGCPVEGEREEAVKMTPTLHQLVMQQLIANDRNAGSRTNFWTTFHTLNRGISFRRLLDLQILLRS